MVHLKVYLPYSRQILFCRTAEMAINVSAAVALAR